jgi:hypothetical protein
MFWLTMSNNISTTFSVIASTISSLRLFLWTSLGSLVSFIFVLLQSGTEYQFSSFPSESSIKLFLGGVNGFQPFLLFPSLHLVLCNSVLDRIAAGFSYVFFPLV